MTEIESGGPSLIKLGKLANSKEFDKLENLWDEALSSGEYTWRELMPIAGQVGRQNAVGRAEPLMTTLVDHVEKNEGAETALLAILEAATQLPQGTRLLDHMKRLYLTAYPDFLELPDLLELLLPGDDDLAAAVKIIGLYLQLQVGGYALENTYLVPGIVENVNGETGALSFRFDDRHAEYNLAQVTSLRPRPADFFPAMIIYAREALREMANDDPVAFVKAALRSTRDGRIMYKELKGRVVDLLGDKGWKGWWTTAKPALKRDAMIGMSVGSQPAFRLLRQADKFEDRLRREYDFAKTPLAKLLKVMGYLDEISREEKNGTCDGCVDDDLLVYFGNGAAKVAVSVLKENPSLALAGLTLHAEVAARGAAVARPNPKAAAQVVKRIDDLGALTQELPEALLQRVLIYLQTAMPDDWGTVWAAVLLRAGKRLCDAITRGLIEGGQTEALAHALNRTVERPTSSPDLMGWMWRTRFTTGPAAKVLLSLDDLPESRMADAMFNLLDTIGNLYGMSLEEKHLKVLESARAALATQNNQPLLGLIDKADRREAIRLKGILENNAGLSPAQRTQLLGYLRSKFGGIFIEITREWEEPVIYTTEAGMRLAQEALNHIVDEEIPEVARQIGEAASFGDLSENAEYTAALEKRDQLASRATRMKNELLVAKIINLEMSGGDFVNAGTRVTALATDLDVEEVYTFLGPWDTDVEQKVLNYQAPLPMAFMGSKVGDTVSFGEAGEKRSWEILKIEPAV